MLLAPDLDPASYIGYPAKASSERTLGTGGLGSQVFLSPTIAYVTLIFIFIHLKTFFSS